MPKSMLDLETMGNKPGCPIIAIGAVEFAKGELGREFYAQINLESAMHYGLKPNGDTIMWWMKQSEEARAAFKDNEKAYELTIALKMFRDWLAPDSEVWGNGADFDNTILAAAYDACGMVAPWKFYNNRCYRTMKSLFKNVPVDRVGTYHNALDDAKTQAMHLMKGMKLLAGGGK